MQVQKKRIQEPLINFVTKSEFIILKFGFGCSEQRCFLESASGVNGFSRSLGAADQGWELPPAHYQLLFLPYSGPVQAQDANGTLCN